MYNPYKHILIESSPVMIDFERAYYTKKPKNLTQFCQFITNKKVELILKKKKIRSNKNLFIPLLQKYKNNINKENFNKIIKLIK